MTAPERVNPPDRVKVWGEEGKYPVPSFIKTPNQIKQRKLTFYSILSVFIAVWAGPFITVAKSSMAQKALGSLNQQPTVILASLPIACIPWWCLGNCFSGQDGGFVVTASQADGRWKLCHVNKRPFLLCSPDMADMAPSRPGKKSQSSAKNNTVSN